jgi:diadenosine tetraphosphate (Ap4A) HIT family hydrolase
MRVIDKADAVALLDKQGREQTHRQAHELNREPAREPAHDAENIACVACTLVATHSPAVPSIAESEHGLLVLNRFGAREGHLLVVARRHVEHIHELSWPVYADLQRLAFHATRVLQARYRPARIYAAVFGSASPLPMSYPHLHIHIVPVQDVDAAARSTRVFSWSDGVVIYDDAEASALAIELQSLWSTRE